MNTAVLRSRRRCALGVCSAALTTSAALGAPFDRYGTFYRPITMPLVGAGSFGVAVEAMPDGRLIALTGNEILLEAAPGSNDFAPAAFIDESALGGATDPAFLSVSPDGSRLAIGAGDGKPLLIVETALLNLAKPPVLSADNSDLFNVPHFAATWFGADFLLISAGDFGAPGFVSMLDVTSDPAAPVNPIIIANIGGSSSGVGVDADDFIYAGNGFDISPNVPGTSETGWIKCFSPDEWMAGAEFEEDGVHIGDVLSAASLRFNDRGDLFVGGGDFSEGDTGNLAVIQADALLAARTSKTPINTNDPAQVRTLDPLGNGLGFYAAAFNPHTDELILADFAGWFATSGRRPGDLNGDDMVDGVDLAQLLTVFGTEHVFADMNADGVVDGADLATLLTNWGKETP